MKNIETIINEYASNNQIEIPYSYNISGKEMRAYIQGDPYDMEYDIDYEVEVVENFVIDITKHLIEKGFNDKDIDNKIEYIRDVAYQNIFFNYQEENNFDIVIQPHKEYGFDSEYKRWIDHTTEEHKELLKILNILSISPKKFIEKYQELYDISKSLEEYQFDINQWKEEKHFPAVNLMDFIQEMEKCEYPGFLSFLGNIPDHQNFRMYEYNYVVIPKGTTYGFYDDTVGGGSYFLAETTRDLQIKFSDANIYIDDDLKCPVDSCYGFTRSVWKNSEFYPTNREETTYNNMINAAKEMVCSYTNQEIKLCAKSIVCNKPELSYKEDEELEFIMDNIMELSFYKSSDALCQSCKEIRILLVKAKNKLESFKNEYFII